MPALGPPRQALGPGPAPPPGPHPGSYASAAEQSRRLQDFETLCQIITQWNANRLDLFALSLPNEVSRECRRGLPANRDQEKLGGDCVDSR